MKIAFITHFSNLYGANRSLLNLIDGLKDYGVQSYVVTPFEGELTDSLKQKNIEFAILPLQWWVDKLELGNNIWKNLHRLAAFYPKALKRLYLNLRITPILLAQLQTWEIDIIYTNSSATPIGALAAYRLNIPHIWHLREFLDLDYNLHFDWGKQLSKFLIQRSHAQISISQAISKHFSSGLKLENMKVIYNGIASLNKLEELREQGKEKGKYLLPDEQKFTFALVGLVHPNKGQDIAIKALSLVSKRFPHVRLIIAGTSYKNQIDELKKLVNKLGVLNQVEFWGYIEDPYQAYLAADVVLMCSKHEGMGRVTVEAMSVCRPVIGFNNGGTAEIIQHEYTGLLYQDGHESLANCMERLIENPKWVKEMGLNAWHVVKDKYSIEAYSQQVYQVLESTRKQSIASCQ